MDTTQTLLMTENPDNMHLCFNLDENTYALNVRYVLEITSLPLINSPQKLSEYVIGILNYNDLFINVVDIRKVFSFEPKKYELSNKVIIVKGEESLFAIIVDEVKEFFNAVPAQVQRVMGGNLNSVVKNFYKLDDTIVNIIDVESVEQVVKNSSGTQNTSNYLELFPTDEESVCIMQKRRNDIAAMPEMHLDTEVYGKNQYVVFKLNGHTYCLYSLYVKELISPKNYVVTKIPYTPDFIDGIINLKGDFYTVLNLKKFIGFNDIEFFDEAKDIEKTTKIVVFESNEIKLAFYVDNIVNIINISEDYIEQKNDITLDSLYIKAEACIDGEIFNILNVDKLINDERLYVGNAL